MRVPARPLLRRLECLESRDVPNAVLARESFETLQTPALPSDWSSWSDSADAFLTTRLIASDGAVSLAARGTATATARIWQAVERDRNSGVSVQVRANSPSPIAVIARGHDLETATPSYVGAIVDARGRTLEIVEDLAGMSRRIGAVTINSFPSNIWLDVTVQPYGTTATVRVQRSDTGQFLNPSGGWQSGEADAIAGTGLTLTSPGEVGLVRQPGGAGLAFVDDFRVYAPPIIEVKESFDTTNVGQQPAAWTVWTNQASAQVAVASQKSFDGPNALALSGAAATSARSWLKATQPADVQATAAVFTDTLIPATIFVRGSDLDTLRPSYYGLTVTRGLDVRIVRMVNGTETTLAAIRSKEYLSYQWVKLTLTAQSDRLRAVVFRTDTGKWLTADGLWSDDPQPALEATDTAIGGDGFVGLGRSTGVNGTVNFDAVSIRPATQATGPQIAVTASQAGSSFAGDVRFRASATGSPRRVEFRLDGRVRSANAVVPADWTLDTTALANSPHSLSVWAVDDAGNATTLVVPFTANNPNPTPPPTRPDIPRHYEHIRIAQLAYSGTPIGDFEKARLRDSVDLVIPNPQYLATIEAIAPTTPKIVYTNLSNLYQGLLLDWLSYADRTGADRELAFYHAAAATPFTGGSPSSQPVNLFWSVVKSSLSGDPTDLTAEARGGRVTGVSFGAAGEAVSLGFPDRFREVNLDLAQPAASGWQGVWEYASAVDAAGMATQWKPLPTLSDSSGSFAKSGQLQFDPPADWVPSKLAASGDRLYNLRVRTAAGTAAQAPVAKTILGRDYVGAKGALQGTIPAFDYAADRDGDGYLNDAEYARRGTGKDARFVTESRVFYPYYGQMRFATNPSSSAVRRWAADYHARLTVEIPLADGFFLDNSQARLNLGSPTIEPLANYADDYASMVRAVWQAIAPRTVVANTAGGWADADPVAHASTAVFEEFALRASEANWSNVADVADLVARRLAADSPSPYVILDSHPGSLATTDPRLQIGTLAYYYLLADPDRTMLMFFGGSSPAAAWSTTWIPAISKDVGKPTGPMTIFATGTDPQNAALTYKVLARTYGNALMLYKPRSYTLGQSTGTLDDATATTHDLGGRYRVLNADGTLGAAVASIRLRNGDGAVLLKV